MSAVLDFVLPARLEAREPPEARGLARDEVRLLVAAPDGLSHHRFDALPALLRPGDVLVVNTSGTLAAAVRVVRVPLSLHFSTRLPDGRWAVEVRGKDREPHPGAPGELRLPGGATATLEEPWTRGRLWAASVRTPVPVPEYLRRHGEPIRYPYVRRRWPLSAYQTVFAREPGSAEMPSAARPFSERVVTRLVAAGVQFAPLLLHTGVASPEAHERPYPEWYAVPPATARLVNNARAAGARIIAVGTTAVRALESAAAPDGTIRPHQGYTDLIITRERGVTAVDGLLTGFHEPRASHLDLLAAVADPPVLTATYESAVREGYLWHEFGDVNLLLPGP